MRAALLVPILIYEDDNLFNDSISGSVPVSPDVFVTSVKINSVADFSVKYNIQCDFSLKINTQADFTVER